METKGCGQEYWKSPSATGFSKEIMGGREMSGFLGFRQDLGWEFCGMWEAEARQIVS